MLSVMQGSIKYPFFRLRQDSTSDWTQVSWAIGDTLLALTKTDCKVFSIYCPLCISLFLSLVLFSISIYLSSNFSAYRRVCLYSSSVSPFICLLSLSNVSLVPSIRPADWYCIYVGVIISLFGFSATRRLDIKILPGDPKRCDKTEALSSHGSIFIWPSPHILGLEGWFPH